MKLRKISGWILVFTPAALIEAISILPNAIGMMILFFLLFLGAFTIVRKGLHLKPYHIIYRRGGVIETF